MLGYLLTGEPHLEAIGGPIRFAAAFESGVVRRELGGGLLAFELDDREEVFGLAARFTTTDILLTHPIIPPEIPPDLPEPPKKWWPPSKHLAFVLGTPSDRPALAALRQVGAVPSVVGAAVVSRSFHVEILADVEADDVQSLIAALTEVRGILPGARIGFVSEWADVRAEGVHTSVKGAGMVLHPSGGGTWVPVRDPDRPSRSWEELAAESRERLEGTGR